MSSYNKAILTGRVGQDAELKQVNNTSMARFSLATSEVYKDKSGAKQEKTQWHNIVLWGALAENLAQYITKGKQLMVEGKVEYSSYEKDGVKMTSTQIKATEVVLLGSLGSK